MKIAFVYGAFSIGNRPIDFNLLLESDRGLTGSELSCLMFARHMKQLGHDVSIYIGNPNCSSWESVKLVELSRLINDSQKFDVIYSWNEPDVLRDTPKSVLRIVNQQLNDFEFCKPGFDEFVDIYTSPSLVHMEYLKQSTPDPNKWVVLPNGCEPSDYLAGQEKIPGRVIYASSPDRGLHLLLQCWPQIKKRVPSAHLKVFYNLDDWIKNLGSIENSHFQHISELGRRARYVDLCLQRMAELSVEKIGSVSRNRIIQEMNEATVLAYPCDTVRFTEGFSVTTMEACAAGAIPVISDIDALGGIYGTNIPIIRSPIGERLDEFIESVVRSLTDLNYRQSVVSSAKKLAELHSWSVLSKSLETIMMERLKR